jgi:hypothetical protein
MFARLLKLFRYVTGIGEDRALDPWDIPKTPPPEPETHQTRRQFADLSTLARPSFYAPAPAPRAELPLAPDEKRAFYQQVHGIYFRNDDGSSRQDVIRQCGLGEELKLVPEPTNPRDPNAIKVCRLNGQQLGYLPSNFAVRYVNDTAMGWTFRVTVEQLFPADRRGAWGCKLRFGVLTMSRRTEERERKRKEKQEKDQAL